MKKALILTYYWPPGSGPGVQRWLKFSKYLPQFGIQPTIITVKNGSYPSTDASLLADVPEDLMVYHTATVEPFAMYNALRGKKGNSVEVGMGNLKGKPSLLSNVANYARANFFIPDARVGWNKSAYRKAFSLVQSEQFDCVITTGPPHSTHLVGEKLHRETGLPWIVDLRDPWTNIYYNAFLKRTEKTSKKDKALEDRVVGSASAVIVASPAMKDEFQDRANHIAFIPNGYDEEDLSSIKTTPRERFILAYTGNLKSNQNCTSLWQAVKELAEDSTFRAKFRLEITGNIDENIQREWKSVGINDIIRIQAFVPHQESINIMHSSHMLLLPIPQSAQNKGIITGKIFEYLASRRPILSVGPKDGNAAEILSFCGKEPMLDYTDKEGMKTAILDAFNAYMNDPKFTTSGNEHYKTYGRLGTTEQLSQTINAIAP